MHQGFTLMFTRKGNLRIYCEAMSPISSGAFFCHIFAAFLLLSSSRRVFCFILFAQSKTPVSEFDRRIRLIKILAPRLTSCLTAMSLVTHSTE